VTVGNVLPCCCGGGSPCTAIDIEALPDEIQVSISYSVTYAMTWYRVLTIETSNFRPFDPAFDNPGDNIYGPNNDLMCCFPPVLSQEHDVESQYLATLTMQLSGVLLKSVLASGSSSRLYQGQLGFEYEFESDSPGTSSVSGASTPASPALPTSAANYNGISVRLACDANPDAYARGMLLPYNGVSPSADPDSIIASGPMLRLSTSWEFNGWQPAQGTQTPAVESGGTVFIRPQAIGWPTPPLGSPPRVTGTGKLQPLQTHWVRQDSPIFGSYNPARTASSLASALARSQQFNTYPRTKPLSFPADSSTHPGCNVFFANQYGPADQQDPDWQPHAGGWILADSCSPQTALNGSGYTDPFGRCPDIPADPAPSCSLCVYGATVGNQPAVGEPCFPNGWPGDASNSPVPSYEPESGLYFTSRMWMDDMSAEVS
jgi:hypothetical protein